MHLSKVKGWSGGKIRRPMVEGIRKHISRQNVWVIELSVPELFSANLRKIGEVVLWSDREVETNRDFTSFVLARLPGYFAVYKSGGATNPKFQFVPSGVTSHVPLIGT